MDFKNYFNNILIFLKRCVYLFKRQSEARLKAGAWKAMISYTGSRDSYLDDYRLPARCVSKELDQKLGVVRAYTRQSGLGYGSPKQHIIGWLPHIATLQMNVLQWH